MGLIIGFLQYLSEYSRADWSRAIVYESIDHGNDVTCQAVPVVLFLFFVKKINVIVKKALQYNHACGWWFHLSFEHFMTSFLFSIRVQTMENCGCPFFFRCLYN